MSNQVGNLASLLREAVDRGLVYWEPVTARGAASKADMIKRIEAALSVMQAPKYSSESEAIEDWMTIAPEYRTRERLQQMLREVACVPDTP